MTTMMMMMMMMMVVVVTMMVMMTTTTNRSADVDCRGLQRLREAEAEEAIEGGGWQAQGRVSRVEAASAARDDGENEPYRAQRERGMRASGECGDAPSGRSNEALRQHPRRRGSAAAARQLRRAVHAAGVGRCRRGVWARAGGGCGGVWPVVRWERAEECRLVVLLLWRGRRSERQFGSCAVCGRAAGGAMGSVRRTARLRCVAR